MFGPEYNQLAPFIPSENVDESSAYKMLDEGAAEMPGKLSVLDLGCGDGRLVDHIKSNLPDANYTGVDIDASPEVNSRTRNDVQFQTFDGVHLPFDNDTFDIVYSRQVFEHVRHPDDLVREIRRVLKSGGMFLGSMSGLEPYHSYSIFNLTPYGVYRLLDDNDLKIQVMRPGRDGLALIFRQLSARKISWISLSYWLVSLIGLAKGYDAKQRNYLKLRFTGHICFRATKKS